MKWKVNTAASYLLYILVYMYIIDSIEENLLSPLTIGYDDKPLAFQMRTLSILLMDLRDRVLHVSGAPTNTSIYLCMYVCVPTWPTSIEHLFVHLVIDRSAHFALSK